MDGKSGLKEGEIIKVYYMLPAEPVVESMNVTIPKTEAVSEAVFGKLGTAESGRMRACEVCQEDGNCKRGGAALWHSSGGLCYGEEVNNYLL